MLASRGDVGMECVVPLALVWVLCVSGAPNVTRRRLHDVTIDEDEDKHTLLYDDDERVNISGEISGAIT